MSTTPDPIVTLAAHAARTDFDGLPDAAVKAAKVFILDTFACALAGSTGPSADETLTAARRWGNSDSARVWARADTLPPPSAAAVNAYQIHCLEFDCIHEGGVLHPMSSLMAAAMAEVDRLKAGDVTVSGRDLITAAVLGIDISCSIASASKSAMRFFRPAATGGFGATTAVAKLRGFDQANLHNALGLYYGQASGNMQAHLEGSKLLGLQVGFAARNGLIACDLAEAGIEGPKNILTGMYGFLVLYEGEYDLAPIIEETGKVFRMTEIGHKPFPSGRLTHYAVDALQRLLAQHGFTAADVDKVRLEIPPLPLRLVGRPDVSDPAPNYAKLCLGYVCATTLLNGTVTEKDFLPAALTRTEVHDLAARVEVLPDGNPDPNAFGPQKVTVTLKDGREHSLTVDEAIGHPRNPLSRDRQLEKFWSCWDSAAAPLPKEQGERLLALIDDLENLDDAARLTAAMCPD